MLKAYVGRTGDPADGKWTAHIEHEVTALEVEQGAPAAEMVEMAEFQGEGAVREAVEWARQRTGWVLVAEGNGIGSDVAWAGNRGAQPPDVTEVWDGV